MTTVETTLVIDSAEAAQITARIRAWVQTCPIEDVVRAYIGRIWLTTGHDSWRDWCDAELGGFRLPAIDRKVAAVVLRQEGLSQAAIAAVTGAHQTTIGDDLQAQKQVKETLDVVGQDGKVYPSRPSRPKKKADHPQEDSYTEEAYVLNALTAMFQLESLRRYSPECRRRLHILLKETATILEGMNQ